MQEVLQDNLEFLKMKIRISSLLEIVFQKNKNERVIAYKEITDFCSCAPEDIEFIVVKAFSLGLIKGYVDEVEQKVIINWIKPKYLEREKVAILNTRIENWITKSKEVLNNFEAYSQPLLN